MTKKKLIIWDWNGTLLNDMHICVQAINHLLSERKKPVITIEGYKEIFTFPVKNYYIAAGFDFSKESFDGPALQFMDLYKKQIGNAGLFPEAVHVLKYFQSKNLLQALLSAMEHQLLLKTIKEKHIDDYFQSVLGIEDHFANGKVHQAQKLFKRFKLAPEEVILIGDTIHDHEKKKKIGCDAILISHGHQSHKRLLSTDRQIIHNLEELTLII